MDFGYGILNWTDFVSTFLDVYSVLVIVCWILEKAMM
jgi:hypothetical protein